MVTPRCHNGNHVAIKKRLTREKRKECFFYGNPGYHGKKVAIGGCHKKKRGFHPAVLSRSFANTHHSLLSSSVLISTCFPSNISCTCTLSPSKMQRPLPWRQSIPLAPGPASFRSKSSQDSYAYIVSGSVIVSPSKNFSSAICQAGFALW